MIRVAVPQKRLPDPAAVDEFNQYAKHHVSFELYDGPHEVALPDLEAPSTSMYYKGTIRSFMPPQAYPHHIICAISIESLVELAATDSKSWPLQELAYGIPYRSVIIVEFDQAIVYLVPGSGYKLSQIDFRPLIGVLQSAKSEFYDAMLSFGGLGVLAVALAGSIYLHFMLLEGKPVLLGTGPHYRSANER